MQLPLGADIEEVEGYNRRLVETVNDWNSVVTIMGRVGRRTKNEQMYGTLGGGRRLPLLGGCAGRCAVGGFSYRP